jgi:hypothetical protein
MKAKNNSIAGGRLINSPITSLLLPGISPISAGIIKKDIPIY